MSDEDEEYEIEAILEARVGKAGRGRKAELSWEFLVRWKDYSPEYDSWEPLKNLESGSQEALSHFLERISTGERDYRDLSLFKAGETFLPVGPPKSKGKGKTLGQNTIPRLETVVEPASKIENPLSVQIRQHDSDNLSTEDSHSSKRLRLMPQNFNSKPNLLLTDAGSATNFRSNATVELAPDLGSMRGTNPPSFVAAELETINDLPNSFNTAPLGTPAPAKIMTLPSTNNTAPTIPLHRARVANPLVQQLPDEDMTKLQIHEVNNLKGRSKPAEPLSSPRRRKPGPGRSSDGLLIRPPTLLTADKGKLKSVRGKRKRAEDHTRTSNEEDFSLKRAIESGSGMIMDQPVPIEPPKPEELLTLAGFEPTDGLPEYEETETEPLLSAEQDDRQGMNANTFSSTVVDSLLPYHAPELESNPAWKRPTIFGPLGLGADTPKFVSEMSSNKMSTPFRIKLDSTYTLPVLLVDRIPDPDFPVFTPLQQDPPGKFYRGSHATDVLGTIRTKGTFARISLSPDTAELHTVNFRQFVRRLSNDELFVVMVGQDLLAFCSSNNGLFTQRLNISPSLLSPDMVLVAHVLIDNYSAFADATTNADDTTWSQYMLST